MPPPPACTTQDAPDDGTEYLEFMQLQGDAQQSQGNVQDTLLAALHNANAQGVDINEIIKTFAEQAHNTPHNPSVETAPAGNPMTHPIPKKQHYDHGSMMDARSSNPYAARAMNANMTYFNAMFPSETKAGGVPLPCQQHAPGYVFPYNMIGPSDNAQAMGFQPHGTTKHNANETYLPRSGSSSYLSINYNTVT
uniref:Uncharacterized protein n=1 Tax=Leptocylindrus danicus TaxID=163516 RepID=A0A7S2PFX5_9STRA|mmetsp:Transcript_30934/g.45310  ORF Transcript_30934/g.45310 Transcript_30934/m.45310 type:complete len:194 (+) Transcript_30934:178-759(+)